MKSVVICEKKNQADKLREALGNRYGEIIPLSGHILTLKEPEDIRPEWQRWGFDVLWPGHLYPTKIGGKKKDEIDYYTKLLNRVKSALVGADQVIIATDCDREGQVIGQEVLEYLKWNGKTLRALFNALDKKSLEEAFANAIPNERQQKLFEAGQARQQCDQVANLSRTRAASKAFIPPGSRGVVGIGRVKSPTMAIICQREQEIIDFKPHAYYEVLADVQAGEKVPFRCSGLPKGTEEEAPEDDEDDDTAGEESLEAVAPLAGKIMDKAVADGLAASVSGTSPRIVVISAKKSKAPPSLYDLSALQAAASAAYGWSGDKTLEIAQSLYSQYEVTTYPRSDVKWLPESETAEIPQLVKALLRIPRYEKAAPLLQSPIIRKGKQGHFYDGGTKDESHYAIVPNGSVADKIPEIVANLPDDPAKLFDLIARRYMAALAPDYQYRKTDAHFEHPWAPPGKSEIRWKFSASGAIPVSQGWRSIIGGGAKEDGDLPPMENGKPLPVVGSKTETKSTKAPARFTDGSIITMMKQAWRMIPEDDKVRRARLKDAKGIGTSATRGAVIAGLVQQGLITRVGKQLKPSPNGMTLWRLLKEACPLVMDPVRTAIWETMFDAILRGEMKMQDAIDRVVGETSKDIESIRAAAEKMGGNASFGKAAKPSEKALAFAQRVAEYCGKPLPANAPKDASVVMKFIDENAPKDAEGKLVPLPPSAKSVEYAKSLAARMNTTVPDDVLKSGPLMRAWIDEAMKKAPPLPPSEKALQLAEALAESDGTPIPADVRTSFDACKKYIDKMREKGVRPKMAGRNKPTEKQLAFARSIAERTGKPLPPDAETSFDACKAFIDANNEGGGGGGGGKPTEKALSYARSLAEGAGKKLPAEVEQSAAACRKFIDEMKGSGGGNSSAKGGGKSASSGTGKPTDGQIKYAEMLAKERGIKVPADALKTFAACKAFIDKTKNMTAVG